MTGLRCTASSAISSRTRARRAGSWASWKMRHESLTIRSSLRAGIMDRSQERCVGGGRAQTPRGLAVSPEPAEEEVQNHEPAEEEGGDNRHEPYDAQQQVN